MLLRLDAVVRVVEGESTMRRRVEVLRARLADPGRGLLHLRPAVRVPGLVGRGAPFAAVSVVPERCAMFASTATCALVALADATYAHVLRVIYKRGDDLRRDAAMLRLFRLCARTWAAHGMDELVPGRLFYGVVPVGAQAGLVEFVEGSRSIAALLAGGGAEGAPAHVPALDAFVRAVPGRLDAFVRSCAGFSVLTFVFGVGDRHLDNLLLTADGHVLHIDFAYRYGADPKPFPPPIKLAREMVAVMLGDAGRWLAFKRHCRLALAVLRAQAHVITAAVALSDGPGPAAFVAERLRTGEDAFDALIEESRRAFFPQVMEALHKWAQYWKS